MVNLFIQRARMDRRDARARLKETQFSRKSGNFKLLTSLLLLL
jgi:hypothetical protein